ncbi:MAG: winged helix-turn-helix transcriptional regulator [Gemmatimonadales bacterium]
MARAWGDYLGTMVWNTFDPACPTRQLLDRVGDKWTVLVIAVLSERPTRFGQLRRSVGGVAPKVLTAVLRSLERDGFVRRQVYTASPLRVEYRLTPLGRSLAGVVEELRAWTERQMSKVAKARGRYDAEAKQRALPV